MISSFLKMNTMLLLPDQTKEQSDANTKVRAGIDQMSATTPNFSVLAAIAAITTIIVWIRPDPTTIGLGITAIAGLAGFHIVKNSSQTGN